MGHINSESDRRTEYWKVFFFILIFIFFIFIFFCICICICICNVFEEIRFKLKQSAQVIVLFLSCPVQYRKARQDPILSWEQKQMFGQKRDTADQDAFTIK